VAAALEANLDQLGIRDVTEVLRGDAKAVLRRLARAGRRFDLVFADPPYGRSDEPARLVEALAASGVLAPGAGVVVETRKGVVLPAVAGLPALDERRYGDTVIHRLTAPGADEHPRGDATMEEGSGARRREGLALFAASFDPVTNGHLDLVRRARSVFPELVVAVARNVAKQGTFTADERLEMLRAVIGREPGIRITSFDGLLVDYAREIGARVLIRGLRAVSDFEYEFEMALMNRKLSPEIETLFMMTSQQFFYVSSSRLKELVRFGANVEDFVPAGVAEKLKEKLGGRL
jgi:pantetheine-phosphate adenylyltransferase